MLLYRSQQGDVSSSIALEPLDYQATRLIMRVRADFRKGGLRMVLYEHVLLQPGDSIMMRKQLLGIRARAQQRTAPRRGVPVA